MLVALCLSCLVTGCGAHPSQHSESTNSTVMKPNGTIKPPVLPSANNSTAKLDIYGTVKNVQIGTKSTLLSIKVYSVAKIVTRGEHDHIQKNSVISVLFHGTPRDYFIGSPAKFLPVNVGQTIAIQMTYHRTPGSIWESWFDNYLYKDNGSYLDWKGQSFGKNPFNY